MVKRDTERAEAMNTFNIPYSLTGDTRFSFVAVFRESTEYCRLFTLPFDMLAICVRENESDPSVAEVLERGERFPFHCNDISLTTCDTPMRYRYTPANEHLCIHFRLELFPGVDVFSGVRRRFVENSPELRREGEAIFAETDPILMLSKCREFALKICHRHWPEQYPFDRNRIQPFRPMLDFVRNRVDAAVGIPAMAAMTGWSEGYFTRTFHEVFHQSPKQYLQRELFSRAAQLLLDPGATVKSVAAELKFSSEFYFSRFFKRLSGISPLEYRKNAFSTRKGQKMT